jgi:pimeloyl-ACP methyl ester carboxylesterase
VTGPASHRFTADGGIARVVHDWGGAGSPILLAHATGFHGRIWAPVAERLAAAGHRVLSFDFRGHGDSDAPPVETESYSWTGFADDVLAVTDHLDLAGTPGLVACGHSKGAASLLLGEATRPGTFPRIVAFEPIVFASEQALPPQEDFFLARAARKRRNTWSSVDEAFETYASKPPLNVMTPASLRAYVEYGLRDRGDGVLELKCRPEVEARVYSMAPNNGAWSALPTITAAVSVVCGAVSTDIGPELAAQIVERLPHGTLHVMEGCGHFGPQQDPDAFTALVSSIARRTERRTTRT